MGGISRETPADPRVGARAPRRGDHILSLEARGVSVLGPALGGPETATTLHFRQGNMQISDGPFVDSKEFIARIDVVSCTARQQSIDFAAAHPFARYFAVEVRPFYSEAGRRPPEPPL